MQYHCSFKIAALFGFLLLKLWGVEATSRKCLIDLDDLLNTRTKFLVKHNFPFPPLTIKRDTYFLKMFQARLFMRVNKVLCGPVCNKHHSG